MRECKRMAVVVKMGEEEGEETEPTFERRAFEGPANFSQALINICELRVGRWIEHRVATNEAWRECCTTMYCYNGPPGLCKPRL